MHSAIIVAEPPQTDADKQRWQQFASMIAPLKARDGVEELADNVWLIDFQCAPSALARLIYAGEQHQFSQRILPLPEQPKWLLLDSKPKRPRGTVDDGTWEALDDD